MILQNRLPASKLWRNCRLWRIIVADKDRDTDHPDKEGGDQQQQQPQLQSKLRCDGVQASRRPDSRGPSSSDQNLGLMLHFSPRPT